MRLLAEFRDLAMKPSQWVSLGVIVHGLLLPQSAAMGKDDGPPTVFHISSEVELRAVYTKHLGSGSIRTIIEGGEYRDTVYAVGSERHEGMAELVINGGTFFGGVAGIGRRTSGVFRGSLAIVLNGGRFYNQIVAAAGNRTLFEGRYELTVNGGVYGSVTDVKGTVGIAGGAVSTLKVDPRMDMDAEETGDASFVNPLIRGADPWAFQHKGYYYVTTTGGVRLVGFKVTNLADLPFAKPVEYWRPATGRDYSRNLWSPKIYRLSAEEAGENNAGWYLYVAADDGNNAKHRMFVLRGLTDDPFGPYGSLDGGALNVPTRMTSPSAPEINSDWCVGGKLLRLDGKLYFIWVGRIGDGHASEHWQVIYLARMANPWTLAEKPQIVCRPTLPWEKHGAGVGRNGIRYPEVVEGGVPVVSREGGVFLVYSGSGYWTPHYALGLMKLVGRDPAGPDAWQKGVEPIFRASSEVNGTGNASFVESPRGRTRWAVYHAYVGKKTHQNPRQLFAEPYTADRETVTIGAGRPQPIGTRLSMEANPMPLRKKIADFHKMLPRDGEAR